MEAITTAVKTSTVTPPLGLGIKQAPMQTRVETPTQQQADKPITEKDIQQAIHEISNALVGSNESIGFNYEQKLGQLYVQVTDNISGEVIREFPSKDFIKHKIAMQEMIGLLLDKQA